MGRIAGRPSGLETGLMMLTVALLLASGSLGSPADEPKSKDKQEKKADGPKSKGLKPKKAEEAKSKSPEEEQKAEQKAKRKDEAFKVAEAYLVLLDKGKYGESWDSMTADVKKGTTRRKWVDSLGKARTPFGKFQGRKLKRIEMRATEVADRFDEAWVYADFLTVEGEAASELIVVILEKGKTWVVNNYYIGDPARFPKLPVEEEEPAKPAAK